MTFSPNIVSVREQRSLKHRGLKNFKKISLKFGDGGLVFMQEGRFELKYFKNIKRFFKIFFKKTSGYKYNFKKKCWTPLSSNFPLTKKSKNSRMGKGKGSFVRWIVRITAGNKLLETKNISIYRLNSLKSLLEKSIKLKLFVVINKPKFKKIFFSSNNKYFWNI